MAAMTERRSHFSAVAFADRYILAIGGQNEKGEALASVEIYDAQEGRWAPYASLATARCSHRCVCKLWLHLFFYITFLSAIMAGGKVYVLGGKSGESGGRALSSVECFTPGPPGREPIWHEVRILRGCDILRKALKRAGAPDACSSDLFCCGCAQ